MVVPVHDGWRYTNACLKALEAALDPNVSAEVIVVDDASADATPHLLGACRGLRTMRLDRNAGFGAACNAGAEIARGEFVHFLNNDAFVTQGWLQPLLDAFCAEDVAAAVSQLRAPGGRLSEAGGVIWRDGQGWNYGRGDSPNDWRYRSARDVDYGSAASLMVRTNAFRNIGGFDAAYAPAYYEDADLCFRLRAAGGRVVYRPGSIVYHAEGASYGSNRQPDARAAQERNRRIFVQCWHDQLAAHSPPDPANADAAARRLKGSRRILVADEHVPFTDRDAGSRRAFFLMQLLQTRGWQIVFASLDRNEYPPYAQNLRDLGIDVILGCNAASAAHVQRRMPLDVAWLCRLSSAERLLGALRSAGAPKIVFDTVDLHYRRLEREAETLGRPTRWQAMQQRELALARAADLTVAGSESERDLLRDSGARALGLPVIEPLPGESGAAWEDRSGIVFLGNFAHAPNGDAAIWLAKTIAPLVRRELPGVRLTLAGADPTRAVRALAGLETIVAGYVVDAAALLTQARVFAAPLRFGAGTKGKIVYALAHGIAVVTTPVGAEDVFATSEYDDTPTTAEGLAERIVCAYRDRAHCEALVARGRRIAARFTPDAAGAKLDAILAALDA